MYLQIFILFNQYLTNIILLEQELIPRCYAELMYIITNKHNIVQDDNPSLK